MIESRVKYRRPVSPLVRTIEAFLGLSSEPADMSSLGDFAAMVRLLSTRETEPVRIFVRPICLNQSSPRVGRAVGGIGNFSYGVECLAHFPRQGDGEAERFPGARPLYEAGTESLRFFEPVSGRWGSLTGVSDQVQREGSERSCASRACEIQTRLRELLSGAEVMISG